MQAFKTTRPQPLTSRHGPEAPEYLDSIGKVRQFGQSNETRAARPSTWSDLAVTALDTHSTTHIAVSGLGEGQVNNDGDVKERKVGAGVSEVE